MGGGGEVVLECGGYREDGYGYWMWQDGNVGGGMGMQLRREGGEMGWRRLTRVSQDCEIVQL